MLMAMVMINVYVYVSRLVLITSKMDNYDNYEQQGRTLLKSFLDDAHITDWQPTLEKYNPVDGFFTLKDKKVVIEIKTRDIKYANYPSHLIELDKYMNLTKAKTDNNCNVGLYANFFGENLLHIYNLRDINSTNCKITDRNVVKTSASFNGYRDKKFLEIPTKYAQVYVRDNGKWTKQIIN